MIIKENLISNLKSKQSNLLQKIENIENENINLNQKISKLKSNISFSDQELISKSAQIEQLHQVNQNHLENIKCKISQKCSQIDSLFDLINS